MSNKYLNMMMKQNLINMINKKLIILNKKQNIKKIL